MRKILLTCAIVGLVGCEATKTEKIVREQLKDPASAEFKDVKGNCGQVNAKNSYGGYTGFKRFFIQDNVAILETNENEDILPFYLGWSAYCGIPNKSTQSEKKSCVEDSITSAAAFNAKEKGATLEGLRQAIRSSSSSEDELKNGLKIVNLAYVSKFQNADAHALDYLNKCLKQ